MSQSPQLTPHSVVFDSSDNGRVTMSVFFAKDNFWLTHKTMASLFGVQTPATNKPLKNIFSSEELLERCLKGNES